MVAMRKGVDTWEGKLTGAVLAVAGMALTAMTGSDVLSSGVSPEVAANAAKTVKDVSEFYQSLPAVAAVELMKTIRYGMILLFIYGVAKWYISKRHDLKIEEMRYARAAERTPVP